MCRLCFALALNAQSRNRVKLMCAGPTLITYDQTCVATSVTLMCFAVNNAMRQHNNSGGSSSSSSSITYECNKLAADTRMHHHFTSDHFRSLVSSISAAYFQFTIKFHSIFIPQQSVVFIRSKYLKVVFICTNRNKLKHTFALKSFAIGVRAKRNEFE